MFPHLLLNNLAYDVWLVDFDSTTLRYVHALFLSIILYKRR